MHSTQLASLSLTHVYYNPSDLLSLLAAHFSLLPQALLLCSFTLFFATREAESGLQFAGQFFCETLNFFLKHCIKESRPSHIIAPREGSSHGYGMPSSHSQFMAYFAVYLGALIWVRGIGGPRLAGWRKLGYSALATAASWLVAGSRVYLGYHTVKQVLVGYSIGILCAITWFAVTAWVRKTRVGEGWKITGGRRLWEYMLWVGERVCLKDQCLESDLVEDGWRAWKAKEKKAQ